MNIDAFNSIRDLQARLNTHYISSQAHQTFNSIRDLLAKLKQLPPNLVPKTFNSIRDLPEKDTKLSSSEAAECLSIL